MVTKLYEWYRVIYRWEPLLVFLEVIQITPSKTYLKILLPWEDLTALLSIYYSVLSIVIKPGLDVDPTKGPGPGLHG
jgi:hypothetical protein